MITEIRSKATTGNDLASLHDYLRVIRERWITIALLTIIGLTAAGGIWFLRPKEYSASTMLYVSSQTADTTSSAYQGAQLSEQRVTSYVELVGSTRVSQAVVKDLELPESADDVSRKITASSALDSVLINVVVADPSPQRAADIANSVGRIFTNLVNELEQPLAVDARAPVAVRVVEPAEVPVIPSSISLQLELALGTICGLVLGLASAFLQNAVDTSIKSEDRLRRVVDAPNLGNMPYDRNVPARPLTIQEDPFSVRAESFRQLRTNLQFMDVDTPRKIILITSSMPGEGKTTTLANLAIALAAAGKRVLAIDADLRRPRLADLFGLDGSVGLSSVLAGRVSAGNSIQHWFGGIDVLASGPQPPNPSELLGSKHMRAILAHLRSQYDTIIIDSPPLLPVTDAAAIAPATDGVLLICRFKKTKRDQLENAVASIDSVGARLLGTIFTMQPHRGRASYARYSYAPSADAPRHASGSHEVPEVRDVAGGRRN